MVFDLLFFFTNTMPITFSPYVTELLTESGTRLEFDAIELVALIAGPTILVSIIFLVAFFAYRQCQQKYQMGSRYIQQDSIQESVPFMQPGQNTDSLREMIYEYSGSGSGGFCNSTI